MLKKLLKLLPVLALVGCATIFTGTTQTINLQAIDAQTSQPLSGVSCTIADGKGMIYSIPSNPGSVLVTKGAGGITPNCRKDGYVQKSFGVGDSFNAVTMINILFWPGFIVDAMTGSMHKYPSHITVVMEKVIIN